MTLRNIHELTPLQERRFQKFKAMLSNVSQREAGLHGGEREYPRKEFGATVLIALPIIKNHTLIPSPLSTFSVWAYDISESGLGFISLNILHKAEVFVGFSLPNMERKWKLGMIVRSRPILSEEFIDYGIEFCSNNSTVGE